MQISYRSIIFLSLLLLSLFSIPAVAQISPESSSITPSPEATKPVSPETTALPSGEAVKPVSAEAQAAPSSEATRVITPEVSGSQESSAPASKESSSTPPPGIIPSAGPIVPAAKPPEEGATYKEITWGSDFANFKKIKNFSGDLGPASAAFVNSADDNDIALLLDVPISSKGKSGEQRVMFEYVPQKFASVYFEPDDVYYIFYNGKFAMAFSRIAEKNFDIYRDNLYKKYLKTGGITKQYAPAANKSYRLDAILFNKGKTSAFLIRGQTSQKKKIALSAKLLFFSPDLIEPIRSEIREKIGKQKQSKSEKEKDLLKKDLQKID